MGRRGAEALAERQHPGPWATPLDPAEAGLIRALVDAVRDAGLKYDVDAGRWRIGPATWDGPCGQA